MRSEGDSMAVEKDLEVAGIKPPANPPAVARSRDSVPKPRLPEGTPPRRPIPLPPRSLRPPPRVRPSRNRPPDPEAAPADFLRESRRGSRRGFLIGLGIPLLVFTLVGGIVFLARSGGDGVPGDGLDVTVRARTDERSPVSVSTAPGPSPDRHPAALPGGATELVTIQIASFRTVGRAEAVLAEVSRRTGLRGTVIPARVDGVEWQRILLGAFESEAEARYAARPLLEDGTINEVLVRPVPERWVEELIGGATP